MTRIAFCGDCSTEGLANVRLDEFPDRIRNVFHSCSVSVFNLEGPILPEYKGYAPFGFPGVNRFLKVLGKNQPRLLNQEWLLDIFDTVENPVVCLANNHILDGGEIGITNTRRHLEERDFGYLGAGHDLSEAREPYIMEVGDKKIGFLNYNLVGWSIGPFYYDIFGATSSSAGANSRTRDQIKTEVRTIAREVNHLYCVVHTGSLFNIRMPKKDQLFFESLECDYVFTHHPHVSQTVQVESVSSCGDFIFSLEEYKNSGTLVVVEPGKGIVDKIKFTLQDGVPQLTSSN